MESLQTEEHGRTDRRSFSTTDVSALAFLSLRGHEPDQIRPPSSSGNSKRTEFFFERTPALDAALEDWRTPPHVVDARRFLQRRGDFVQLAMSAARRAKA